jgi:hypothetical protein
VMAWNVAKTIAEGTPVSAPIPSPTPAHA